jgi:hypothetical protein
MKSVTIFQTSPSDPNVFIFSVIVLVACLLGSLLNLEDGGIMFLRNVGKFNQVTRYHIKENSTLHNHRCKNLKSHIVSVW